MCDIDLNNMTYNIQKVNIGVKDNKIKLIKKIEINTSKSTEVMSSKDTVEGSDEIIDYLTEELNVSREKIDVYNVERSD
jgi:stage III sporulation protein AF